MSNPNNNHLEIERKWLVTGWPDVAYKVSKEELMRQGYVTVEPTVRIREEGLVGGGTEYVLCFKSRGQLTRKEIEFPIGEVHFRELEDLIGLPLVPKVRRTYALPSGLALEVNHVDEGAPTEFWYAEIEFSDEATARAYDPASDGLGEFLVNDVTETPGESMGAYWIRTRVNAQ